MIALQFWSTAFADSCSVLLIHPIFINHDPQILDFEKTLDGAIRVSSKFNVQLTPQFRKLPEKDQLRILNNVNQAYSRLPSLVLAILAKTHFKAYMVADSISNMPQLGRLLKYYPERATAIAAMGETDSERVIFLVGNHRRMENRDDFGIQRIILHELGHAFDRALSIVMAGAENDFSSTQTWFADSDERFQAARKADFRVVKGTSYEDSREFFAETFRNFFHSAETRARLKETMLTTFKYYQQWFGIGR